MSQENDSQEVTVVVNGREHTVPKGEINFESVVALAFGTTPNPANVYTITYERGHENNHEGILVPGGTVKVKKDMIFNVSATGQS